MFVCGSFLRRSDALSVTSDGTHGSTDNGRHKRTVAGGKVKEIPSDLLSQHSVLPLPPSL